MSLAAAAVWVDGAVASLSAPLCPPATMAGMAHGEDFMDDVLLETDAGRGSTWHNEWFVWVYAGIS